MSEFDDDDFGNFEGAEIEQQTPVAPNATPTVLSWIIQNSPTASTESGDASSQLPECKDDDSVPKEVPQTISEEENLTPEEEKLKNEIELPVDQTEIVRENEELKSKLTAATLLKEESDLSFNKGKDELKEEIEKLKLNEEKLKQTHQEEIKKLKTEHEENIKGIEDLSTRTAKIISDQYNNLWSKYEEKVSIKTDSEVTEVVENCIKLLDSHGKLMEDKIEINYSHVKDEIENTFKEESLKLKNQIKEHMANESKQIRSEMDEYLTEQIKNELTSVREIHEKTLKSALKEQKIAFESELKTCLREENEKFTKNLNTAVKEAVDLVKEQMKNQQEQHNEDRKNRLLGAKMFLTSAVEQIESIYEDKK